MHYHNLCQLICSICCRRSLGNEVTSRKTQDEAEGKGESSKETGESRKGQAISHGTTTTTNCQQQVDKPLRIRRVCGGQLFPSCCTLSSSLSSNCLLALPLCSLHCASVKDTPCGRDICICKGSLSDLISHSAGAKSVLVYLSALLS